MQQTTPRINGIEPRQPADDGLTGKPILRGDGRFTEAWSKGEDRYWRAYAANCGECYRCGFKLPRHEDGCPDAPSEEDL